MNRIFATMLIITVGLAGCSLPVKTAIGTNIVRARAEGAPILVFAMGVPGQIQDGSMKTAAPVFIQFYVTSNRTIKRIRFGFGAYSPRGDPVRNDSGNQLHMILIGPGNFVPGKLYEVNTFHAQPAGFPGGSVTCVELEQMTVTYADGQLQHITQPNLAKALVPQLRSTCRDRGPRVNSLLTGRANG